MDHFKPGALTNIFSTTANTPLYLQIIYANGIENKRIRLHVNDGRYIFRNNMCMESDNVKVNDRIEVTKWFIHAGKWFKLYVLQNIKILEKKPMKIGPGEILYPPVIEPKTVQATAAAPEPEPSMSTTTASLIGKRGQNSQAMAQASKRRSMAVPIINVVEIDHVDTVREINLIGLITSKSVYTVKGFNIDFADYTG